MTHDLEVLRQWIRIVQLITCVAVTSFPILYSFTPWRTRPVGKILMLQGIAFATAMDVSSIISYWRPTNIILVFWIYAFILTFVAVATSLLSVLVVRMNRPFFRRRR
jgi:uncharacterized membrane protein YfcA